MRVSKEKAAQNRQQILSAATRLFRENGIRATGVDSISRSAGLTHGAFYSQFESKGGARGGGDPRRAVAVETRLAARGRPQAAKRGVPEHRDGYLSPEHRDSPARGCVVAALGPSVARQPRKVRAAFTAELKDAVDFLAALVPGDDLSRRHEDALSAFACMIGALILARAVDDRRLSDRILESAAKRVVRGGRRRK